MEEETRGTQGGTQLAESSRRDKPASLVGKLKAFWKWGGWWLHLPLAFLWMETVARVATIGFVWGRGLVYLLLFTVALGLAGYFLCTCLPGRGGSICGIILLVLTLIYMSIQMCYYKIFDTFVTIFSITTGAGDAMQFMDVTIKAILDMLPWILLTSVPVLLFIWQVAKKRLAPVPTLRLRMGILVMAAVFQLAGGAMTVAFSEGLPTDRQLYTDTFLPISCTQRFGFGTTLRINLRTVIFPELSNQPLPTREIMSAEVPKGELPAREPKMLEIDFNRLMEETDPNDEYMQYLHSFFASERPTEKNDYTGIFAGRNLIVITAESYSPLALDPELTPNLWRLATEGVQVNNFYCPLWGVSTTDGEYSHLAGLIPKSGTWSMSVSTDNYMPFTLANQLAGEGYTTCAYHNHQFNYYHREQSHPNLGYQVYKGVGNGLEISDNWPESDLEMIETTVDEYMGEQPFHTYYMTVSGHLNYNWKHNAMAAKNKAAVESLPYSEEAKAYLACNIELDKGIGVLLAELEARGIADDTVIVFTADHYPYGLSRSAMAELAGYSVTGTELYRSGLYIWSGDMGALEGVEVDKVCTTQDILPTVSNLFGLSYDSRMLVGNDIFSDAPGLVMLVDYSWITDQGSYDSISGRFTPNPDNPPENRKEYIREVNQRVEDLYRVSSLVLERDYYRHALLPEEEAEGWEWLLGKTDTFNSIRRGPVSGPARIYKSPG